MLKTFEQIIGRAIIIVVIGITYLLTANSAHAKIIFKNEFLIEDNGSDTFIIDSGDDVTGNLKLQFGNALAESITFDTANTWFEFSNDVNLAQNELKNVVIDNLASAPGSPLEGQIYYNTTDDQTYMRTAIGWEPMGYHAATHVNGEDDIQLATNTQKGLMSAAHVIELETLGSQSDEINRNTIDNNLVLGENVASSVAYLTYDNPEGTDFVANIENVEFTISDNTSPGIALTGGTDTNPTLNYVYVRDNGTVEASTTDPETQAFDYVPIAEVLVGTVGVSTATYYYIENLTNFIRNFIRDVNRRLRQQQTIWLSGTEMTNSGLDVEISSGSVMHIHQEIAFPSLDTGSGDTMIDEFYNVYTELDNTNYDDGSGGDTAIGNNKYHKLFIWGDIYGGLHMERQRDPPTSEYTSAEEARLDEDEVAINAVPDEWATVGFPIAHVVMHENSGVLQIIDLRGQGGGGGGAGGGGGHSQNTDTGTTEDTFTLDSDATGTDVTLQFGGTLAETIFWDDSDSEFEISDDLTVAGTIDQNGTIFTLDADNAAAGANVDIVANQGSDSDGTLRYNATTNRWEISNNGGAFLDVHQAEVFYAYDNAGNQTVNGTEITVNIDTTVVSDSIYSLAADAVTVSEAGLYKVTAKVGLDDINTTGGARMTNEIRIQNNAADIAGAVSWCYHRETTSNTCEISIIVSLSASDVIRVRAQRIDGSTNAETRAQASSLMIERIR